MDVYEAKLISDLSASETICKIRLAALKAANANNVHRGRAPIHTLRDFTRLLDTFLDERSSIVKAYNDMRDEEAKTSRRKRK